MKDNERWRVGNTVNINVYAGERPICQCHNAEDAELIVLAVNLVLGCNQLTDLFHERASVSEPKADAAHREEKGE